MLKQLLFTTIAAALTLPASTLTLTLSGTPSVRVDRTISDSTVGPTTPTSVSVGLIEYTTADGSKMYVYCLEPQQGTGLVGTVTTFDLDPTLRSAPGNVGGMSASQAHSVLLLLGQLSNPFDPSLSVVDQAAIQVGLWEIVRETAAGPYSISTGNLRVNNESLAGVLSRAQTLLNGVNSASGTPHSSVIALTNGSFQDMVAYWATPVPEPGTFGLMGAASAAIMTLVVRRRRSNQ